MDRDTLDYLDQKWFGLASKEDLEKLRQEMKANFRLLRDENRAQILEGKQEMKGDLEALKKETRIDLTPLAEEMRNTLKEIREESQSAIAQTRERLESSLLQAREEAKAAISQSGEEMGVLLQSLWKEDWQSFSRTLEASPGEADRLKEGVERVDSRIRDLAQGLTALQGRIGDGIKEIKEELGSMIKFSSADLDKKIGALEARIRALEKIVFP